MKTKIFTLLLAVIANIGTVFAQSGTCGDNLTWNLTNGVLTISGSGAMTDYDLRQAPWDSCRSSITSITIGNSVTSIGEHAFYNCFKLTSVTIGNSVTSIGEYAFGYCSKNFKSVTIPNSVTSIGDMVFVNDLGLSSVTCLGETPASLGSDVFMYCHDFNVYVPCGTLETYKSASDWYEYASHIKYAPYPSYTVAIKANNGTIEPTSTIFTICDEPNVTCTAVPNSGFYFVKWADGNEENPRTIELTQDTTMEAIFDYLLEGKCGADNVLTWKLDLPKKALTITGKGALSANYTYGTFIESLTIGNDISVIGQSAFAGCNNLKDIIIGSSVKVLENAAFSGCSNIKSITCYSQRPPTVSNNALYGLDYGTIVYVPKDYLETYKMHDAWGLYDVRPIGATTTETTDVNVNPSETTATIVWPTISGAATYELVIKDKSGNVVCTLIFNAQGQLTQIAFNTPGRDNAPQQTQTAGFSFTVTGLDEGTSYDLTISAKNSEGKILDQQVKSFTTKGSATSVSNQPNHKYDVINYKYILNGQLFIQRGDEVFNAQGARVK